MPARLTSLLLVLVGCLTRLRFAGRLVHNPDFTWRWGGEQFAIADAIVHGQGFASPYWVPTGPTAQQMPGFPYLVAGIGELFGMQTAAYIMVALNVLCSALMALVLARMG